MGFLQLNKNTLRNITRRLTAFFSLFVVLGVFWCLKLTGITLAGEAFCGMEEHQHGDDCLIGELICEQNESLGHVHDENCILETTLICGQEESLPHVHDESCHHQELICTEVEQEGHIHNDMCHGKVLACGEEAKEGHSHNDACYTPMLVCTVGTEAVHVHTEECYAVAQNCALEATEGHYHNGDCYRLGESIICGQDEVHPHTHDDSCLNREIICGGSEQDGHVHDDGCVSIEIVCTVVEQAGHVHGDTCREQILVCGQEEMEGHVHNDTCFPSTLICNQEVVAVHVHNEACYENKLTCTMGETAGHSHSDACYLVSEDIICGQQEAEGHRHGETCYITYETCGQEETEGHSHTEECYDISYGCGIEEAEIHTHSEECYEILAECSLEEHIHTESCYSNIKADLETKEDWENSICDLTRETTTAGKLVAVARSQLGYTESTLNFEVDIHGVRRGITRYGQWYGNPYGDWSAMFVSFCLHYAEVEDLPANAGPESMRLEWEEAGLYLTDDTCAPKVGNLVFLSAHPEESAEFNGELISEVFEVDGDLAEEVFEVYNEPDKDASLYRGDAVPASTVGIITDVAEDSITIVQGDLDDAVSEQTIEIDNPRILGYGLVPERSAFVLMMAPRAGEMKYLASTINYNANMFTNGRSFVIYAQNNGQYFALASQPASGIEATVVGVPIEIGADGKIYSDVADPNSLLWNFSKNDNNYVIQNAATGRYLHPGGDPGVIYDRNWPTALRASGTGARFVHTSNNNNTGISFNANSQRFEIINNKNNATTLYFGVVENCTVWLDGTNGGLSSLGGSQNQSYSVAAMSEMTLPAQWLSPTKYSYELRGWYDVTHSKYYAPGEKVIIEENTVFYADWIADTYDIGQYNAQVANTVSTNSFITTHLFDYNYLFNVLSADATGSISATSHSENWSVDQNENVNYENRESINFIFLDYGSSGPLDYPNNLQNGVNAYPGDGIVTGGIYNSERGNALFSLNDRIPGKYYLGTADHLFQIMDDESNPYYGYYYYDSARNAASYNQSAGRFYVYDYLEATSAELSASKSDFLPLNSPYANTNGQQLGTYTPDGEHANMTNYVYDAKFNDSTNRVSTNYAFGMKMDIRFYLPNKPGEGGNQDLYGNDMRFMFSGDDDLWVLVDGKLALDIGGIHQAETGEINFSTGEVTVQGKRSDALSKVVAALEPGEHTLTVMYLERGASHSNCAIYFNLAPRFKFGIQKEDVLSRDVLNGAQFSVFQDFECTIPAQLWESQESYLRGDPATNTFTVKNGSANMWGMGAGNTYYIRETRPPDDSDYGFPNGIIRMILDKKGAATYSVMILDGGDGISGGFTVHGFRVDEENQQAYIIATNAPKWVKEVTSVQARKFWADNKDHSGESVTVYLTIHDPDGTVRRLQEAQLNEDTDWQHLWENLPKYYEDGSPIQYGIEEAYVSGYYSTVEKVDSYAVTTGGWAAAKSLENGKTYLLKTNSGFLSTQNRNSDTGFMWVDEAIAKESDLAQWTATAGNGGYKLTNKAGQSITFYYNGGSPTDFYAYNGGESDASKQYFAYSTSGDQIRIYYDAPNRSDYYMIASMTNSKKFQYSTRANSAMLFTPMTQTQSSVTKPVEGDQAFQITNTPLTKETSMTVYKEWYMDIGDDPTLYEQEQVTVKLLANGKDTGRTVTLSLKNGWTDTFRGLPYEDSNGNVIVYTVEESWDNKDWLAEYGPINTSGGNVPTYNTTVTNAYRWGHGVELPSTGSPARLLYVLCGSSIMLLSLVNGFVSRRKRERRTK